MMCEKLFGRSGKADGDKCFRDPLGRYTCNTTRVLKVLGERELREQAGHVTDHADPPTNVVSIRRRKVGSEDGSLSLSRTYQRCDQPECGCFSRSIRSEQPNDFAGPDLEGHVTKDLRRAHLDTNTVEHEQYVLRGRAKITVGDEVHDVGEDDALYIPAGVPHSYEVLEAPFEFICVVPNGPDRIRLVEE